MNETVAILVRDTYDEEFLTVGTPLIAIEEFVYTL